MIEIPKRLSNAIEANVTRRPSAQASQLRESYQSNKDHQGMYDTYLMSRMPATYAAITRVFEEVPKEASINTVLDIGAGPGTGLWAVRERFERMESYVGFEGDSGFIQLGNRLNSGVSDHHVDWIQGRYPNDLPNIKADLVLMSYTVGENTTETVAKTIEHVWKHNVAEWLVIIEPGTPKGYASIMQIRDYIVEKGGYIVAPCMGNYTCPLAGNDWCHFSVRLGRSHLQKKVKDATLPYEDEKFSYLIIRKTPTKFGVGDGRIIKKPMVRPGHVTLDICSESGYDRKTVSKSQKELYRSAKKMEWGDFDKI